MAFRPDAAGDSAQWTPNAGANWEAVDEVTPDGDTTYVASDTVDAVDLYNLAAPSLPGNAVIRRVWASAVARKANAEDPDQIQVGLKSGATAAWSGDHALGTTYALYSTPAHTVDPDDGQPWTPADLDGLQAGVKAS
ncbi:MAG: hypothetical protein M5R40_06635 [Anaerolineae bacterium]|nr:hypothetical protein [Anaerolineae bacterium]